MTNPNDQAFPTKDKSDGLTKREHFAALAMQGICTIPNQRDWREIAEASAARADALIAALNQKQP
jgi:hypothetical protein